MAYNYELCDDILTEIFLATPVKSLFRFKCLSKKWYQIFSSLSFRSKYISRRNNSTLRLPLGCLQASFEPLTCIYGKTPSAISFSTTGSDVAQGFWKLPNNIRIPGFLIGISNGLILCCRTPNIFFVCDPISKKTVQLPPVIMKRYGLTFGLAGLYYEEACDKLGQSISAKFKVVRFLPPLCIDGTILIETYSSDTGAWEESILRCCFVGHFDIHPRYSTTVIHGIFYLFGDFIVVYDSNDATTCRNWVWLLTVPETIGIRNYVLGENEKDKCLLLALDDHPGFRVLKLKKNVHCYSRDKVVPYSEWVCLYFILYPPRRSMSIYDPVFVKVYPRLIALHPQFSDYLLMRSGRRVFWMNLVSRREYNISYNGDILLDMKFHMFPYFLGSIPWPSTLF